MVSDDEEEDNDKKGKRKIRITKKDDSHGEGFDVKFDDIYQLYRRNRVNGDEKEETKSALSVASTDMNQQGSFMPAIFNSRSFVQRKPIEAVEKIQRVRQVLCQPKSQIEKTKQPNGESTIFSNDSAKQHLFHHHNYDDNPDGEVFDNPLRRVGNFAQPVKNLPSSPTSSASASSSSASSSSSSSFVFSQRKGITANKKQKRKGGRLKDILYSGRTAAIIHDDSKSGSDDIYDEKPSSDVTSSFYKNKTNHQTNNNNSSIINNSNNNNKKKKFRKKFLSYLQSATRQREIKKVQPVSSNQRQTTLQEVMEKRRMTSHGNDERVPPLPQATNETHCTQRTALRRTAPPPPPPPPPPLEAPLMTSSSSFTPISRTTRRRAFKLHYQKKKKNETDVSDDYLATPPRSLLSQLKKSLSQKVGLMNKTENEETKEIGSNNKKGLRTLRRVAFNQSSPALRTNHQGDRRSSKIIPAASKAFHKDFSSNRPSIEYDADQAVIDSSYKNYLQLIKGKRSQQQHPPSK